MEINQLVKEAKAGNEEAFEELLGRHKEQLYRTAYLYMGNREDALDVVQETSYKAYIGLGKLKTVDYFSTWLIRILIFTAYEHLRKRKKAFFFEKEVIPSLNEAEENLAEFELLQVVGKLRKKYRDVILLHYFQDLSVKEISVVLEIPEGTVKTYLYRGRNQIKEKLKGVDEDGERKYATNRSRN